MALSIKRWKSITNCLNPRWGLLSMIEQSSCWSSSTFNQKLPFIAPNAQTFGDPHANIRTSANLFSYRRFKSVNADKQLNSVDDIEHNQFLDLPGGKVLFTPEMRFISESPEERAQCYRVLDNNGQMIMSINFRKVSEEIAVKMYCNMVMLQTMDAIFYEAQRQGRISFFATTTGEEAINIASAAALTIDDIVVPQYREPGVLLWRGFTLQEFANQCFGNKADYGKGRQMPIHYGSNKHRYFTVAATIATQIPHAVGAAYSLKMDKRNACVITYFGDGGSSEGDFHAALNFAAVLEVPVIFFCRNNGWAISTPTTDQFRSDGVVARGCGYGIQSIRIDGNDALAIYSAVQAAREMAISECRPILIEALTYRAGHHSTSDDSTKYRPIDEIDWWRSTQDPVARFRKWIDSNGWWCNEAELELRKNVKDQVLVAIQVAEKVEKPPLAELFKDVYDVPPSNLCEQEKLLRGTFDYICSLVKDDMTAKSAHFVFANGKPMSLCDSVAVALRRLSSGESLVTVGDSFGLNHSTVSQVTWRFVEAMEVRGLHHLKWPSTETEMAEIKSKFEKIRGLPNCCGVIDTTHIMMCLPQSDPTSNVWLDPEKNHSMVLQAIVDPDMRFRDIVTGWPGKMKDWLILQSSNFYKLCDKEERLNGKNLKLSEGSEIREYIIGDSGYPLLPYLIIPYEGKELSPSREEFNRRHHATQMVAQRALARLKDMWKIIHGVMWRPDKHRLPRIILVCCLLHNIIIDMEDEAQDEVPLSHDHDAGYHQQICGTVDIKGVHLRDKLSLYLSGRFPP